MNDPFEGDTFIPTELKKLRDRLRLKWCVETGTQYGSTTAELAKIFQYVDTVEADHDFSDIAVQRMPRNASLHRGLSQHVLPDLIENDTLYYLDAHGCAVGGCPLKKELEAIARAQPRNIAIAIHDFQVPGTDFGFDTYDYPLEWSEIAPIVARIFRKPHHYYNSEADGARRGIIYIHEDPQ